MKLYTVVVYDLRMCMKVDNTSQNYFKDIVTGSSAWKVLLFDSQF